MSDEKSGSDSNSGSEVEESAVQTSNVFITDKVKKIFKLFDMDQDELINMDEMRNIFR